MRKKEDPKKVLERVRRYRQNKDHQKIEIVGVTEAEREKFMTLKGLDDLSFSNKLRFLMMVWEKHYDELHQDLRLFQKENDIPSINLFNDNCVFDPNIINYIISNEISSQAIINKLNSAKKHGITEILRDDYLLYLKEICEKSRTKNLQTHYVNMINNKKYTEVFLQKIEAEKKEKEINKELLEKYIEEEVEKARKFLVGKKEIYFSLIKENLNNPKKRHMAVVILTNTTDLEHLLGNKLIIRALLPDIHSLESYPYISFEEWKKLQVK